MGIYDERQPDYAEKYSLYKKCYDSVLKEFKNDNILVFHSIDEIFEKYPQMKKIIDNNKDFLEFQEKFLKSYFAAYLDLIRLLFTYFLNDYLYLDSDIYVLPTFKKELVNRIKNNKVFYFYEQSGISCFYSKRFTPSLQKLFKKFNKSYLNDVDTCILSKIKNSSDIENQPFSLLSHYVGLKCLIGLPIKKIKNKSEKIMDSLTKQDTFQIVYSNRLIFVYSDIWIATYQLFGSLTLQDFIKALNYKGEVQEFDSLEEFLKS